jgi:hypothetical protein
MKAGELRCPTCQAKVWDIAPDLELGPRHDDFLPPPRRTDIEGHCRNGHRIHIIVTHSDGKMSTEVRAE